MTDQLTADLNDALAGNFLLVSFRRSNSAGFTKTDRNASNKVVQDNHAQTNAARVVKDLLVGAKAEYRAMTSEYSRAYTYHMAATLPWHVDGQRLLPTTVALEYLTKMTGFTKKYEAARNTFIANYPAIVQQAIANQGGLGDPSDYPVQAQVQEMFKLHLDVDPMPSIANFDGTMLPPAVAELIGKKMANRQQRVAEQAVDELRGRIEEFVGRMATQLRKHADGEKTKLFASLVGNLKPVAALARSANLTNDEAINSVVDELDSLAELDIDVLRANPGTAGDAAERARAVVKRVANVSTTPIPTPQEPEEEEEAPITPPDPAPPQPFDTAAAPTQGKAPDPDLPWWAQDDDVEYPEAETY